MARTMPQRPPINRPTIYHLKREKLPKKRKCGFGSQLLGRVELNACVNKPQSDSDIMRRAGGTFAYGAFGGWVWAGELLVYANGRAGCTFDWHVAVGWTLTCMSIKTNDGVWQLPGRRMRMGMGMRMRTTVRAHTNHWHTLIGSKWILILFDFIWFDCTAQAHAQHVAAQGRWGMKGGGFYGLSTLYGICARLELKLRGRITACSVADAAAPALPLSLCHTVSLSVCIGQGTG